MKELTLVELRAFAEQDPRAFVELVESNNVMRVKSHLAAVKRRNAATVKRNRPGGRAMHVSPSGPAPMPALFLTVIALGAAVWLLAIVGAVAVGRRIFGQG